MRGLDVEDATSRTERTARTSQAESSGHSTRTLFSQFSSSFSQRIGQMLSSQSMRPFHLSRTCDLTYYHSREPNTPWYRQWPLLTASIVAFFIWLVVSTFLPSPSRSVPNADSSTTLIPMPCQGQGRTSDEINAARLADAMNVTLEEGDCGTLRVLGRGGSGAVYALVNGVLALKYESYRFGGCPSVGQVIASSLPRTLTLLNVSQKYSISVDGQHCITASIFRRIHGADGREYDGKRRPILLNEQALSIAADLAVGLHVLHTKIRGYAVMHCDLHKRNIMVVEDQSGYPTHGVLIDYGDGFAQKLRGGENVTENIFDKVCGFCHNTNWTNFGDRFRWDGTDARYSGATDWRDLGILLYSLVENKGDLPNSKHPLFQGVNTSCDYRCAAKSNLQNAMKLKGSLKDLVSFLVLEHDQIDDEVGKVLSHPAFASLPLGPAAVDRTISSVQATNEFVDFFAPGISVARLLSQLATGSTRTVQETRRLTGTLTCGM